MVIDRENTFPHSIKLSSVLSCIWFMKFLRVGTTAWNSDWRMAIPIRGKPWIKWTGKVFPRLPHHRVFFFRTLERASGGGGKGTRSIVPFFPPTPLESASEGVFSLVEGFAPGKRQYISLSVHWGKTSLEPPTPTTGRVTTEKCRRLWPNTPEQARLNPDRCQNPSCIHYRILWATFFISILNKPYKQNSSARPIFNCSI